jgi:hypothetical protein
MFATALILGFAGSLHCVGMCSPLMIAATNLTGNALRNRLIYNTGRLFTYALLGSVASALGSAVDFSGSQKIISIVLGSLLILAADFTFAQSYFSFFKK